MVYAREIEGETLTFGVSGKLLMNGLVMYDRETDSLWSQVSGDAIYGTYDGSQLTILPALMTTWTSWLEEHPDTKTLDKNGRQEYRFDPYEPYYGDDSVGLFGRSVNDERLDAKELVIGVNVAGHAKAYPFSSLSESPVINDEVGGVPLLVTFKSESRSAAVFNRTVNGLALTFEMDNGRLTDVETGSVWSALTGRALRGELAGMRLTAIPSVTLFWFAWADFYPDTAVHGDQAPQ